MCCQVKYLLTNKLLCCLYQVSTHTKSWTSWVNVSIATPRSLTTNKTEALCIHAIVSCVIQGKDRHAAKQELCFMLTNMNTHRERQTQTDGQTERERERDCCGLSPISPISLGNCGNPVKVLSFPVLEHQIKAPISMWVWSHPWKDNCYKYLELYVLCIMAIHVARPWHNVFH